MIGKQKELLRNIKVKNKVAHAIYEKDKRFEYCFLSSVTAAFFKENESILYEIIKSFDFSHEDYGHPAIDLPEC